MCKYLPLFLLALALAVPALAKDKGASKDAAKGVSGASLKGNYGLGVDESTGGCEIRKLGFEAEPPLGFRLIGVYAKQEQAAAAEEASAACKNGPRQDEKRAELQAVEKDCQTRARKKDSSLLGLLSGLGATAESTYAACMKANGYSVNR